MDSVEAPVQHPPAAQVNVTTGDAPSREEMKATIEAAIAPVRTDLKWLRWLVAALAAATASPKFGGPELPTAVAHAATRLFS